MIGAGDLLSREESLVLDLFLCSLFSGESERSGDEPAVFVDKERMHAHLMEVSSIVEFSMIDQKGISVVVDQDRIMALGTLAACHAAPTCVGAHKLHATVGHRVVAVIEFVFAVDRADTLTIDERTVGVLAAEDTHHIARIRVQTSVREEEIVVVADMTDKSDLRRKCVESIQMKKDEPESRQIKPSAMTIPQEGWQPEYKQYPYLYNIVNVKARDFYELQGMEKPLEAFEVRPVKDPLIMQCRYCIRYSLGYCVRHGGKQPTWREPLYLQLPDGRRFRLQFKCDECQMNIYAES
jgi:hypothetical protein